MLADNNQRNKLRRNVSGFNALIASVFSMGTVSAGSSLSSFALPSSGAIYIAHTLGSSQGGIVVQIGGNTTTIPALLANQKFFVGYGERLKGVTISRPLSGSSAGTINVYVQGLSDTFFKIATGTFA